VDLGCGSVGLCKYKEFEFYLGFDISKEMLKLNPCNVKYGDFNEKEFFESLKKYDFEQFVSFSSLQWAKDLEFIFKEVAKSKKNYLFAIFTSNTFKSLHDFLKIKSPIYEKEKILKYAEILKPKVEIINYKLTFESPKQMLNYIKYSGVKGEVNASICALKKFYKTFPVNFLEFEIVVLMG